MAQDILHNDATANLRFDFIALIAGLMHGTDSYFADPFNYTKTASNPIIHAGSKQAIAYLRTFSVSDELIRILEGHPISDQLGLDYSRLEQLKGMAATTNFLFSREGMSLEVGEPYMTLYGTAFGTGLVLPIVKQIVEFQTILATKSARDIAQQKKLLPERFSGIVDVSSARNPNPTIAAYSARARKVGGWQRWITHHLQNEKSRSVRNSHTDQWRVYGNQIENLTDRKKLMEAVDGLTSKQVREAYAAGIRGVTTEELMSEDLSSYAMDGTSKQPRLYYAFGQYMFDQKLVSEQLNPKQDILFVDSYYQHLFSPTQMTEQALYGVNGLPVTGRSGEKIEDIISSVQRGHDLRAKYWRIPTFKVETVGQLEEIAARIREEAPDGHLLYRGQNNNYTLPRSSAVKKTLYGDEFVRELSLTTSASRVGFDYDRFSDIFQLDIQGLMYMDLNKQNFLEFAYDVHGYCRFLDPEVAERNIFWKKLGVHWDAIVMGIAQHYRVPTNGLDLTGDIGIALWMALREPGPAPVIYLVSPMNSSEDLELPEIPGLESTRQLNQSAFLHYGGWVHHKNLCAEEVVAAVFLSREFKFDLPSDEFVFPNRQSDSLLNRLLRLRQCRIEAGFRYGYELIG